MARYWKEFDIANASILGINIYQGCFVIIVKESNRILRIEFLIKYQQLVEKLNRKITIYLFFK